VFSNGLKRTLAQIAMANFNNPPGLEKAGESVYRSSVNSGEAQLGTAGTGGRGFLQGQALEMSNVDLGQEFTNLVVSQRGFQANSKVITTADELLQELVNMKR
jgi:flagellar hook protein FlgE